MFDHTEEQTINPSDVGELSVPEYGMDEGTVADSGMPDYAAAESAEGGIIDFDTTDTKDPFATAPHGNYRLVIKEFTMGAAKNSGSPMISAVYEIIGPPDAADEIGKQVFDNMVMQGKGDKFGKWRFKQIKQACGFPESGPIPTKDFIGKEFDAELKIQPADEQNRAKNVINNVFTG